MSETQWPWIVKLEVEQQRLQAEIERQEHLLAKLEEEIKVGDYLIQRYRSVLQAIPECPEHGECIPWALEWIEKAKAAMTPPPPGPHQYGDLCPICEVGTLIDLLEDGRVIGVRCCNCEFEEVQSE